MSSTNSRRNPEKAANRPKTAPITGKPPPTPKTRIVSQPTNRKPLLEQPPRPPRTPKTPKKTSKWPDFTYMPIKHSQWRVLRAQPNVMLLATSRTGAAAERKYDRHSATMSVAAIAYSYVYPTAQWTTGDIDKIMDIGKYLQRASWMRKQTDEPIQPRDVISSFYVDFIKITTLVGSACKTGSFRQHSDHTELLAHFEHILANCEGCIFMCNGRHYALWSSDKDTFFLFHPCDHNDRASYAKINETGCVRIPQASWLTTLTRLLKFNGNYEIVSVKIMQLQEVSKYPEDDPVTAMSLQKQWSDRSVQRRETIGLTTLVEDDGRVSDDGETDEALSILQKMPSDFDVSPYLDDFEQAYVTVGSGRDVLRGMNYVDKNVKIASVNVAAIVMLRVARAFTWTCDTVEEILTLGNRIYDDNLQHVVGSEVVSTDIVERICLGRCGYRIDAEQAVFGALSSTSPTVVDLLTGLSNFFVTFDAGVLQGPQNVAVWHELGHFYMFDAKERDRFGRKWVASMVTNDMCGGDMECMGRACVTRYTNIVELVAMYTETVPLKYRHDAFRITKIEVNDFKERSANWNEWKGVAINRWILRGRFSQGNQRFAEEHRNCQATCVAAVALVFSGLVPMDEWNVLVVDEIMVMGDEFYRQCVERLMKEDKLVEKELRVGELSKYFTCREQNIELIVDDCLINGSLLVKESDDLIDLKTGLDLFFTNNNCGILTSCGQSLAVWRVSGAFYVFDSHARDSEGRNPMTCRLNLQTGILGTSCALRFLCLSEVAKAVTDNFQLKDASEFNLSRVDYVVVEADGTPPLRRYAQFGERAAMLRSLAAVHEGQRQLYDLRSGRQTLCNCLVALSMVQLHHSANWTRNDLFDILRMGDQMFTRISTAMPQPLDDDFAVEWEHLITSEGVTIGINRFSVTIERTEGQFELVTALAISEVANSASTTDSKRSKRDSQDSIRSRGVGPMAHRTGSMLERLSVNASVHAGGSAQSVSPSQRSARSSIIPPPSVLKDLLKKWDESDSAKAVLESILFRLAIWKQNKLYFVFDPKACNETGKLTAKRLKAAEKAIEKRRVAAEAERKLASRSGSGSARSGDIIEDIEEKDMSTEKVVPTVGPEVQVPFVEEPSEDESEESACYTAWFMTLEELQQHLLSLVSQEHRAETISMVHITLQPASAQPTLRSLSSSNFQLVTENPTKTFILRASMSQNDQIFPKTPNRNRQDVTNCVTAIALATFCLAEDWTATILDVVLKYGDRLYTKSLHSLAHMPNALEKLNIHQVVTPFILANVRIDVQVESFGVGDLTAEPGNLSIRCVHDVLTDFFKSDTTSYGVLVARQYHVAVWRMNNEYYMFDAHDIGPDAKKCMNGVACLCRFESIEPMGQVFATNLEGPSGNNAFELFSVKLSKTKLPNEVGVCTDPSDNSGRKYRMLDSKGTSAYRGSKEMKILHGNIDETSVSLKWNLKPPTACHAIAALATSRDVRAEFWTPRTIDQILILGNELYDKTLQHIKADFDPELDRLHAQHVRKNFPMSGHLVHVEMELLQKGIVKCRQSGEISLKIGMSRLFGSFDCGTIETPSRLVGVWQECGYFYIFYPNATDSDGLNGSGTACVVRFTTQANLYKSLMHNIPKELESDTFEIRSCDFTLSPLRGRPLSVAEDEAESKVTIAKKSNVNSSASLIRRHRKVKRRTTCYKSMPGNREILSGTVLCRKSQLQLIQKQSGAKAIVAIAMSFIEDINRWSSRTVDLIVASGVRLYNEAVVLHKSSQIQLCQLPRKLFIGDISLQMQILSPTLADSELCEETLVQFFEEHTMAYIVRDDNVCVAVIRLLNQFFFFDSTPCCKNVDTPTIADSMAARVLRFKNFQQLLEHLSSSKLMAQASNGDQVLMGPIKCWR